MLLTSMLHTPRYSATYPTNLFNPFFAGVLCHWLPGKKQESRIGAREGNYPNPKLETLNPKSKRVELEPEKAHRDPNTLPRDRLIARCTPTPQVFNGFHDGSMEFKDWIDCSVKKA